MEYSQGQDAWFNDQNIEDNPYEYGSWSYKLWELGYKDARWKYEYATQM